MHKASFVILTFLLLLAGVFRPAVARDCAGKGDATILQLIKDRKFDEAEKLAKAAVQGRPDDVQARYDLATVYIRRAAKQVVQIDESALGKNRRESALFTLSPEEVQKAFKTVPTLDPDKADAAERTLDGIIEKWPAREEAYFCLMDVQQKAGKHPEFLKTLDRTAKAFRKDRKRTIDDLLGLISYYVNEQKRLDLAAESYRTALDTFPKSSRLLSSYGAARIGLGSVREGREYFLKAYRIDKRDPIILHNLGESSLLVKEFAAAENYYLAGWKLDPTKTSALFDVAMIRMADGPERSVESWKRYLAADAKHPDDGYWSGLGRQIMERAEAGMDLASVISLAQNMINVNAGKYAVPLMVYVSMREPDEAAHRYLLAQAYDSGSYYDLAREELQATATLVEQGKTKYTIELNDVYFNLARAGFALDRPEESLEYLRRIEARNAAYTNLQYFLGRVLAKQGKGNEAKGYFEQCMQSKNNEEYAKDCRENLKEL